MPVDRTQVFVSVAGWLLGVGLLGVVWLGSFTVVVSTGAGWFFAAAEAFFATAAAAVVFSVVAELLGRRREGPC